MARLGKQQLPLLCFMGSPSRGLVTPDKVSNSLVARGLLQDIDGLQRITAAGLRQLADEMEAGRLEQFMQFPAKAEG